MDFSNCNHDTLAALGATKAKRTVQLVGSTELSIRHTRSGTQPRENSLGIFEVLSPLYKHHYALHLTGLDHCSRRGTAAICAELHLSSSSLCSKYVREKDLLEPMTGISQEN
jgi:hypothetical protein